MVAGWFLDGLQWFWDGWLVGVWMVVDSLFGWLLMVCLCVVVFCYSCFCGGILMAMGDVCSANEARKNHG